MPGRGVAPALLVVLASSGVLALSDNDIPILHLPVNITSWGISLQQAFNRSLVSPVSSRLSTVFNDTINFLRNGSVTCTPQGQECIPGVPSCCPSTVDGHLGSIHDEDLQCLPVDGVYRCTLVTDSEDVAQLRLDALENGDSAGHLESHQWVNSWEFQSRSTAEREELQAMEEDEWRKNWKPSSQETDNFWFKAYNQIKNDAMKAWKDLRKMKKLKEVKDFLMDKKNKRLEPTAETLPEQDNPSNEEAAKVYPDELSEEKVEDKTRDQVKTDSEENIIKFSDELPKRDKKLDFKLGDIIKYAIDKATGTFKNTEKEGGQPSGKDSLTPSLASEEEPPLDDIQGTVDKLMKEVDELKTLKAQQEREMKNKDGIYSIENKMTGQDIDQLIHKHVHNILEEKRRLYDLKQIEKSKRLKQEGGKT